ncbi:MAG: aminotransferase class III-fold pyridoxal phosphate-dependent enzyme [Rhodospirillaceae bacterium]|nr:aminotransferase class III-fold pyridoxal phosphate-dependent enzyme [Rhodospirillaceae bacterium]
MNRAAEAIAASAYSRATAGDTSPPSTIGRHKRYSPTELGEFDRAAALLPGGALGGNQLAADAKFVFARAQGARFWDTSGNEYVDYCLGSGAMLLGHAHQSIQRAVTEQVAKGTHYFAYLNEPALELAEIVARHVPCVEKMRFTVSGSEATFHAMRLSRGFTGREKIIKFEGAYHGHHDYAQISTTPKRESNFPEGVPDTAGIPRGARDTMLIARYNDLDCVRQLARQHKDDLAAIIVEPIQRIIQPQPGFLEGLREIATEFDCVLIFDEVVTGWRLALGGAQEHFGVMPDLSTFGKVLGGGLPVGGVGGRADIMDLCDPTNKGQEGFVYQNGTLNGNPLGMAAAVATLRELEKPGTYERLFERGETLRQGLRAILTRRGIDAVIVGYGPMWHLLFGAPGEPRDYRDIQRADGKKLTAFDTELIRQGFFALPGNRRFVSLAHTDKDFEDSFAAFDAACRKL